MKNKNTVLIKYSEDILSLQLKIENLLKDINEEDLSGEMLNTKLILAQAKHLLQEAEKKNKEIHKDHIEQNIIFQDISLLNNQICLLNQFLECLQANQKKRKEILAELEEQSNDLLRERFRGANS